MSTSPDQPRHENLARRQESGPPDLDGPRVSPVRGLIWLTLIIAIIVLAVMYWEVVWDVLSEFVPLSLEFIEQTLDTLFELVGLSPAVASIATAYTGVVLGLVVFYVLLRKSITVTKKTRQTVSVYKTVYKDLSNQWYARKRAQALEWWESLDWLQKVAAVCALVLIVIPLALLLSFILGTLVAMAL